VPKISLPLFVAIVSLALLVASLGWNGYVGDEPRPTSAVGALRSSGTPAGTPTSTPTSPPRAGRIISRLPPPHTTPTPSGPLAVTIREIRVTTKVVALTFDAGADRGHTPELLALLKRDGVKATFGVTGRWAESNPDLIREMVADGQEIMNHTYDHRSFTGVSARPPVLTHAGRIAELDRTESIVHALTGVSLKPLFRPPYGDQDASVLRDAAADGYRYSILWTVDSDGWRGLSTPQIVERCLKGAKPGAIYVFHVESVSHDVQAMPAIINGLRARGYSFATIGELLHLPSKLRA